TSKFGVRPKCKSCTKIIAHEYYRANTERCLAWSKKSLLKRSEATKTKIRENMRLRRVRDTFGISFEQFVEMIESQDGKCKICRTEVSPAPKGKGARRAACID